MIVKKTFYFFSIFIVSGLLSCNQLDPDMLEEPTEYFYEHERTFNEITAFFGENLDATPSLFSQMDHPVFTPEIKEKFELLDVCEYRLGRGPYELYLRYKECTPNQPPFIYYIYNSEGVTEHSNSKKFLYKKLSDNWLLHIASYDVIHD